MYRDEEVLSFAVTFGKRHNIRVLEKLAHFDKAPFGMKEDTAEEELNRLLSKFIYGHAIATPRWDYESIIKNTGVEDDFELSFKGHGLSLFNHYWFRKEGENLRYEDINFFANGWDDSFGRAVLRGDYEALKNVDLNVPDIVTAGWGIKGWLYEDGVPKLYKLGIAKNHYEEVLTEVLTSRCAKRMLKPEESLEYELKEIYGKYASVCKAMIGVDEELVPLSNVLPHDLYEIYFTKSNDRKQNEEFFRRLSDFGMPELYEFFVKVSCLRSLCFAGDLHFDNLSIIRNLKTGKTRMAPLYDLGSSFGSGETGRKVLSKINKATYIMVYFIFGGLDPNWDYSWYRPESLLGFEDEIREILSKSDFYTPELIDNIIDVYQHQKATLDEYANRGKKS